ncbi:MAG TPA: tetratricopeptide repeat protein [Dongiaceae bacterium]|nr:tetratricopeptide repeat protein [Dongiaceae bacterium]
MLAGCAATGEKPDANAAVDRLIQPLSQEQVDAALRAPELAQAVTYRAERKFDDMVAVLRASAGHDNPVAELQLAQLYARGEAVPRNEGQAERWLRKAAEQGMGEAQVTLAERYFAGQGGNQDALQGWHWLRIAEAQDRPAIWAMIGEVYLNGVVPVAADRAENVPAASPVVARAPDAVAALYYFQRAADADSEEGELALCLFYMQSRDGRAAAVQKGQPWCDRAAARGNMEVGKYTTVRAKLPDGPPQPGDGGPVLVILEAMGQGAMTLAYVALYILANSPDLLNGI